MFIFCKNKQKKQVNKDKQTNKKKPLVSSDISPFMFGENEPNINKLLLLKTKKKHFVRFHFK